MVAPRRPTRRKDVALICTIVATLTGCPASLLPPAGPSVRYPQFHLEPVRVLAAALAASAAPSAPPGAVADTPAPVDPTDPTSGTPGPSPGSGASAVPSAGPSPRPGSGGSGGGGSPADPTPPPTDAPPPPTIPPAPAQPPDCTICPSGARSGVVVAAEAPHAPLAGVTVRAGATTVVTGPDGTFALPAPADAAELVTFAAPERATSAVAGFRDGTLTSHLEKASVAIVGGTGGGTSFYTVSGRVVAPAGGGVAPAAGIDLVVTGADGVSSSPATTGVDGRFTLRVFGAAAGVATPAVVWAFRLEDEGDATAIGLASTPLTPGADLGDIQVAAPSGELALAAPVSWPFFGPRGWDLVAVAPSGASFTLARRPEGATTAPTFTLPGTTLEVRAWARTEDGSAAAYWQQAVGGAPLAPVLPAPPEPDGALALAPGAAWRWRPVPEVDGYRVRIERIGAETTWEAFTHLPRLTLPADVLTGPAKLRIVAAQEGGLRQVASLTAPRALRLFGSPSTYSVWQGEVP